MKLVCNNFKYLDYQYRIFRQYGYHVAAPISNQDATAGNIDNIKNAIEAYLQSIQYGFREGVIL